MTLDEIKNQAVAENWNGRKVKDALYLAGLGTAENREMIKLAVEAIHGKREVVTIAPPAPIKVEVSPAPVIPQMIPNPAPQPIEEPVKLEDGAIIYCDAARNITRGTPGAYGRIREFDNGGARIGLRSGKFSAVHFNTQCYHPKSGEFDQFMAECFSVLKAVETAKEHGLKNVIIRNDRIGGFDASTTSTKRGYKAATYLWITKKMAAEAGLEVIFDRCTGAENLADAVSRRNV